MEIKIASESNQADVTATEKEKISPDETEKRKKQYQALVNFFKEDMEIKNFLMDLAPKTTDEYSEESRMEYLEKAFETLREIEFKIKAISESFDVRPNIKNSFKAYFDKAKIQFSELGYGHQHNELQKIYQTIFTDMKSELLEKSKQTFFGYGPNESFEYILSILDDVGSINELLHIIHSSIINNDKLLQSMPIIGTKKNFSDYDITLYGEENEISTDIFNNFPLDLDIGYTDIVSMKNRTLMMIRDRGHALNIDIEFSSKDNLDIRYFVPKICNLDMIKELPGINTSSITNNGANGFFISKKENISENIFKFISKVPTDDDMPKSKLLIQEGLTNETIDELDTAIFTADDAKNLASGRKFGKIKLEQKGEEYDPNR